MSDAFLKPLLDWRSEVASETGPSSPVTRHVLLTLSLHMNVKGESCFPSTKTLEQETGLSERTVCTHLSLAESEGWIRRRLVGYKGKKWARMEYSPTVPYAKIREKDGSDMFAEGTEGGSVPSRQALNLTTEGTEPDDKKALKEVQCSSTPNSSRVGKPGTPPKAARFDPLLLTLPKGLSSQSWGEWIAYRRQRKLSTTEPTAVKQLAFLATCISRGQTAAAVIESSIANGWQGLFEPKQGAGAGRNAVIEAFTGHRNGAAMEDAIHDLN